MPSQFGPAVETPPPTGSQFGPAVPADEPPKSYSQTRGGVTTTQATPFDNRSTFDKLNSTDPHEMGGEFLSHLGSALNPINIGKGLVSAFQHPSEALHSLDPDTAINWFKQHGDMTPDDQRELAGNLGSGVGNVMAGKALSKLPDAASTVYGNAPAIGATIKGAAKGTLSSLKPIDVSEIPGHPMLKAIAKRVPIPGPVAGGVMGASAARLVGLPGKLGAAVGTVAPIIKGAIEGGKAGLADFRAANAPKIIGNPAWRNIPETTPTAQPEIQPLRPAAATNRAMGPQLKPPPERQPLSPNLAPEPKTAQPPMTPLRSTTLPSGRIPGGIQNQVADNPEVVAAPTLKPNALTQEFQSRIKDGKYTPRVPDDPRAYAEVDPSRIEGVGLNDKGEPFDAKGRENIDKIKQAMQNGEETGPLLGTRNPDGTVSLEDGHHRAAAAAELGKTVPMQILRPHEAPPMELKPQATEPPNPFPKMPGEDNRPLAAVQQYRAGQVPRGEEGEGYGQTEQENTNRNGNAQRAWEILKKEGWTAKDLKDPSNESDVMDLLKSRAKDISRRAKNPEQYIPSKETMTAIHQLAEDEGKK